MKRFHFRLERLLKLKRQRERQAELRQRQARGLLDAARTEMKVLEESLSENAEAIESRLGQPVLPDFWMAHYQHMARLEQALNSAEAKTHKADANLEEANRVRAKIATEAESLEHMRTRQWREHRETAARTEQQRLDEWGLRSWSLARSEPDSTSDGGKEETFQ